MDEGAQLVRADTVRVQRRRVHVRLAEDDHAQVRVHVYPARPARGESDDDRRGRGRVSARERKSMVAGGG